jgi:glutamine synthetase adenylyltransferase
MRRWGTQIWGLAAVLTLTASVCLAAEPDDDYPTAVEAAAAAKASPTQRPGLLDYMFGNVPKPAKPAPTASKTTKPKADAPKKEEKPVLSVAEREEEAYFRRLAVCDRLREVAEETKDEKLRQLADQLQDRAWQLCVRRANLDTSTLDETVLNKHLGSEGPTALPVRSTAANQGDRPNQARLKENVP